MRRVRILLLFLLLPVLGFSKVFPVWKVRNFSVNEGLTQNTVYCIFQDHKGYIWVGTGDGLNLLNGHTVIRYRADSKDSCSIVHNAVRGIIEDATGNLLIGTEKGLSILKARTCFYSPKVLRNKSVIPVLSQNHKVLLWFQCEGLFWFDLKTEILRSADMEFSAFCKTKCVGLFTSVELADGNRVFRTSYGNFMYNRNTGKITPYVLADEASLFVDSEKNLWQIDEHGLSKTTSGKRQAVTLMPEPLNYTYIKGFVEADASTLVFGAYKNGLWMFDKADGSVYPVIREGVNFTNKPSDLITCLFKDNSGNIWIGTDGNGLELYRPRENLFMHIHSIPWTDFNLGSEFCRAFAFLSGHHLLIASFNSPLIVYDIHKNRFIPVKSEGNSVFRGLHINSMISSGNQLLFAGEDGLWSAQAEILSDQIILSRINQISKGSSRSITRYGSDEWVVNVEGEIYNLKLRNNEFTIINTLKAWQWTLLNPVRGGHSPPNLILNRNNEVVLASNPFMPTSDTTILFRFPAEASKTFFIRHLSDNTLISGTNYGAFFYTFKGDLVQHYTTSNGLVNNFIYCLLPDKSGRLWCSSNGGIACIDRQQKQIYNFSVQHGIQSPEFNSGAFLEGPGGLLIMGGIRGFNLFYPDNIQTIYRQSALRLTALSLNERPLKADYQDLPEHTIYSYSDNNWWFEVSNMDYTLPSSQEYAFMLDGYDEEWIYTGTHNSIRYQHLPPGKYRFLARTSEIHNAFGPSHVLFQFTIAKPVWQRWWFILISITTIFGITFLVARIYLRNKYLIRIHQLEKEQAVQGERLRISKDMHDDIGTGISQIAILSEIAKKTSHIPETNNTVLEKITRVSGELIDNISNMIWITKPEYDNLESLIYYLREYAGSLFENTGIAIRFELPGTIPSIPVNHQVRRNLFLVYKEALNNILKHAIATEVRIQFEVISPDLGIVILDNGVGFDPVAERLHGGDGLSNMQKRVEESHGSISLDSAKGKGTRILIRLKL